MLSMTDDEIRRRYREGSPIGILAELNACSSETIKQIVSGKSKPDVRPDPHQGIEKKPRATPEEMAARIVIWKQLYDQGLSDGAICRRTNCMQSQITAWRNGLHLPVNLQAVKNTKATEIAEREVEQLKLFESGASDAKIAAAVNVSIGSIIKWRGDNKLSRRIPHTKPANDAGKKIIKAPETVIKVPKIVNAAPDPVAEQGKMFFADIADETIPRKPAVINQDFEEAVRPMFEVKLPFITSEQLEEIKAKVIAQSERNVTPDKKSQTIKNEEVEAQYKATTHILKCQQPYFDDIWEGYKPFEVRLNDREYEAGDSVLLMAFNAEHSIYETRQIFANIGYILSGKSFPALLDEETVVFSLINIKRYELQEVTRHD